jgi:hypothetical protein
MTHGTHTGKNNAYKTFVAKPKGKKSLALGIVQMIIYARP